jgi:tRNA (guanine37-N1)-methyltransferase
MSFRSKILTLFPEMFPGPLGLSLPGQALARGDWQIEALPIRDFATDKHKTVDDTPYGGGAGMVLKADVVAAAIRAAKSDLAAPVIYLSPRGRPLTQARVEQLAAGPGVILLCGRYEGVDQRVLDAEGVEEVSIGDYVLAGGELPAMVLLEAVVRLLPGTLGNEATHDEESFSPANGGLLEYPHFTRPASWEGREVPAVLAGGNHAEITKWRRAEAEKLTESRRPDLWAAYKADK